MAEKDNRKSVENLMALLNCTEAEAKDILKTDKEIDQGKRVYFDLSPEKEKEAKRFANSTEKKKPANYQFKKRERKENTTKAEIIAQIATFLMENEELSLENVEIINKERQIIFKCGEESFDLTLIQKRKPKN